ncbi:FAD-dependent monooxygenase [Methylibium sp.]|uniref:FAD-dependent monooxygenase n=1 Tax=Methylibium sp. TaxID=2067992 RepID=UPI003D0B0A78
MLHTPVLIVGAGPTGLMLACQLARHGVEFRIVDGKAGPTRESRALGVQARTLELFESMGIAAEAVAQGRPTFAGNIYVGRRRVQRIPLGDIGQAVTPFPYLLILEQSRNEALLYKTLQAAGREVNWHTTLTDVRNEARGAAVTVRHADGSSEMLRCDWLVACDGARSPVREQLGLPFSGGTYENAFYVADTRVDWALPHGELTVCLSSETFVVFFPMPGEQRYRVIGTLPHDTGVDAPALRFEDIEAAVRAQMDIEVRFAETAWFSAYRVHHRCVERLRAGRCFIAGDAAHVHSPVGAQGMNTGLQDVSNLAWKLALVVQGRAREDLLDSYHAERWPVAQQLLKTTDSAFQFIISPNPLVRAFRLHVFPRIAARVMARPAVRRRLFRVISQTGIHYRGSRLSQTVAALSVQAGDRLPYAEISAPLADPAVSVYAWLAAPGFHLLLMQRNADGLAALARTWAARLASACPGWFHVHAIAANAGTDGLFDVLGVGQQALVLVRPDQYIACTDECLEWSALESYLDRTLGMLPSH